MSTTTPLRDDRRDARGQDAGGQQVQRVLLVADDDGVAGVVAAVELDDVVDAAAEQVGRLALALVAPLGADDDDGGHGCPILWWMGPHPGAPRSAGKAERGGDYTSVYVAC